MDNKRENEELETGTRKQWWKQGIQGSRQRTRGRKPGKQGRLARLGWPTGKPGKPRILLLPASHRRPERRGAVRADEDGKACGGGAGEPTTAWWALLKATMTSACCRGSIAPVSPTRSSCLERPQRHWPCGTSSTMERGTCVIIKSLLSIEYGTRGHRTWTKAREIYSVDGAQGLSACNQCQSLFDCQRLEFDGVTANVSARRNAERAPEGQ